MKFRLEMAVRNPLNDNHNYKVIPILEDDAKSENEARRVATSISGCNFANATPLRFLPFREGFSKWMRVKMTDTTSYYLYLE